jgi:hypothetical protein
MKAREAPALPRARRKEGVVSCHGLPTAISTKYFPGGSSVARRHRAYSSTCASGIGTCSGGSHGRQTGHRRARRWRTRTGDSQRRRR